MRDQTLIHKDVKVVGAIDIGTSFSGYASSTREMFKFNPLEIRNIPRWIVTGVGYIFKTETCILMAQDGNVVALGDEAKDIYADFLEHGKADEYRFFDRFKMLLYNNQVKLRIHIYYSIKTYIFKIYIMSRDQIILQSF